MICKNVVSKGCFKESSPHCVFHKISFILSHRHICLFVLSFWAYHWLMRSSSSAWVSAMSSVLLLQCAYSYIHASFLLENKENYADVILYTNMVQLNYCSVS